MTPVNKGETQATSLSKMSGATEAYQDVAASEEPRVVRFTEPLNEVSPVKPPIDATAVEKITLEDKQYPNSSHNIIRCDKKEANELPSSATTNSPSSTSPNSDSTNSNSTTSSEENSRESSTDGSTESSSAPSRKPVRCLYSLGRELGSGTYSVVCEVRHVETSKMYAAKVVNKRLMRGREHLVKNEIVVLKRVSRGHPNVLTLVDYFETTDSLYLVTELARGGELFERICQRGAFGESDAQRLMQQVVSGVAHLHAHGIVHRDLKLENLLFQTRSSYSRILICDFGLSRIIDEENLRMLTTTVGTPSYMAPEVFTKKGHSKPVDIWALGIIAYVILSGIQPFDRDTPAEEREAIESGDLRFEPEKLWVHITADAQNFIRQCLQVDPKQRPSAHELMDSKFLTRKYRSSLLAGSFGGTDSDEDRSSPVGRRRANSLEGMMMSGAFSEPPERDPQAKFSYW